MLLKRIVSDKNVKICLIKIMSAWKEINTFQAFSYTDTDYNEKPIVLGLLVGSLVGCGDFLPIQYFRWRVSYFFGHWGWFKLSTINY